MARKRKVERTVTELDEAERSLYGSFRKAVGSVTSLFSLQKQQGSLAFEAGNRHAARVIYQWIYSANEQGYVTSVEEILHHLHHRLELSAGGEMLASSESHNQVQLSQERRQTQREEPPTQYIVASSEVDPTVAADASPLVHSGWRESTVNLNSNNDPSSYHCDRRELHMSDKNESSMDMICS